MGIQSIHRKHRKNERSWKKLLGYVTSTTKTSPLSKRRRFFFFWRWFWMIFAEARKTDSCDLVSDFVLQVGNQFKISTEMMIFQNLGSKHSGKRAGSLEKWSSSILILLQEYTIGMPLMNLCFPPAVQSKVIRDTPFRNQKYIRITT